MKLLSLSQVFAIAIGVYFGVTLAVSQHNKERANAQTVSATQTTLEIRK